MCNCYDSCSCVERDRLIDQIQYSIFRDLVRNCKRCSGSKNCYVYESVPDLDKNGNVKLTPKTKKPRMKSVMVLVTCPECEGKGIKFSYVGEQLKLFLDQYLESKKNG